MSNIIPATFGASRTTRTGAAYQYDYGQVLKFTDLTLPDAYEVHFALQPHGSAVTQIGNADGVAVPDSLLEAGSTIFAWVFLHTGDSDGETEYTAMIPVNRRAKPDGGTPTPVQQDAITEAISALTTGVTRAETAAETAEGIAEAIPGTIAEALDEAVPGIVEQAVEQTESDFTDLKSQFQELNQEVQEISPRASVSKTGNVATIRITDTDGMTQVEIRDGEKGDKGDKGETGATGATGATGPQGPQGEPGEDYVLTAADKQEIAVLVQEVFDEIVSGTAVTIVGEGNRRYLCGEVTSISITPPATGTMDVIFTSGTSVAVLTLPSTVKMPEWFDVTALETNTVYEINITDGVYGAVMMWAS